MCAWSGAPVVSAHFSFSSHLMHPCVPGQVQETCGKCTLFIPSASFPAEVRCFIHPWVPGPVQETFFSHPSWYAILVRKWVHTFHFLLTSTWFSFSSHVYPPGDRKWVRRPFGKCTLLIPSASFPAEVRCASDCVTCIRINRCHVCMYR